LFSLFVVLIFLVLGVHTVLAHANLVQSEPLANAILETAPANLKLWFSEPVEAGFSQLRLYDKLGQEIKVPDLLHSESEDNKRLSVALPALPPNVYTVVWQASSAVDGHTTLGSFVFAVGRNQFPDQASILPQTNVVETSSLPTPIEVFIRWLGYVTMALLTGAFGFIPLIFEPAFSKATRTLQRRKNLVIPESTSSETFLRASGFLQIMMSCWIVLLFTTVVSAVLQAAKSAGVEPVAAIGTPLVTLLSSTRYGGLFWLRLLLIFGLGAVLIYQRSKLWRPTMLLLWSWGGLILNALILLTTTLNSHAAARPLLSTLADWIHLIAVSLWAGGLVVLLRTLLWVHQSGSDKLTFAYVVSRFSQAATLCILTLGLTGSYRAIIEVGDLTNLLDTSYGFLLLLKLGMLLPLLALGAVNLLTTRQRLRAIEHQTANDFWQHFMRRTIRGELIFITGVLLITGILTATTPSRDAFGAGVTVHGQASDLRVVLSINPGLSGLNTFTVYLKDNLGRPITDAEKVTLISSMVEHDMGVSEIVATHQAEGIYIARGSSISMFSIWQIEVVVRRTNHDDVHVPLIVSIPLTARSLVSSSGSTPVLLYPSRLLIGLAILINSVVAFVWVRRWKRVRQSAGWIAAFAGFAMMILSVNVIVSAFSDPALVIENPVPADVESLKRGKLMYDANCSVCHGYSGLGDGTVTVTLKPPPSNLRKRIAEGHSDAQFFKWITQGSVNTAMPAFEERLSEQQRWDIINYIRTFGDS
jgi:copper transport protein